MSEKEKASPQVETRPHRLSLLDKLPPWISNNLRSKRQWKMLVRCWVASWAAFILLLPNNSLQTLGNAAFFAPLASLMVVPNMPVQMFFFAVALILLGMLFGWAFGAAAMKAAVTARNAELLKSSLQRSQQSAQGSANPDAVFILEVFQGFFLDTRSSVVFGVFFGVLSFAIAVGRAYRPRLILFFTFTQIFVDVFCTFGPLFPITEYTILNSILISMACYVAIGLVCCIFIFPETMNHSYLYSVTEILGGMKKYAVASGKVLGLTPEEIAANKNGMITECVMLRRGLILQHRALQSQSNLINAEFSYGRWNGDDAKALEEPLGILLARMSEFYTFPRLFEYVKTLGNDSQEPLHHVESNATATSSNEREDIIADSELMRQLNSWRVATEAEYNVKMEDMLVQLQQSTADLRSVYIEALGTAEEFIRETNCRRWSGQRLLAGKEEELNAASERLRASLGAYKTDGRFTIVKPFIPLATLVDQDKLSLKKLPLRPLIVMSSFAAHLIVSSDALLSLLELIGRAAHKRQHSRLWAPSSLRAIGNFILRREKGSETEAALGETPSPEIADEEEDEAPYRLDPDSRPPVNGFQKVMNSIHNVYKWFKTPEATFGIKYLIISLLLWLPAVLTSSASFYYVNKGVWALVMAQLTLNVFAADQIFSTIMRILGTVLGLIAALLVWYIGNAHGNGNPFGVAAAFGAFLVPITFFRLNSPLQYLQTIIIFNTTIALIVGYSWIDGHLTVVGSPGIGWPVAWKRFVLVMIGFAAATIMMMFPPSSGRKSVRLRNAALISEMSLLYSQLMSVWITEVKSAKDNNNGVTEEETDLRTIISSKEITPLWVTDIRKKVLILAEQVQGVRAQTATAKFEGNIRGAWPAEEYSRLLDCTTDMLASFFQLCSALQHLDPAWRASMSRRTLVLNPDFIADMTSTFALVSQSLRTGEPIPQIMPSTLLERLFYHFDHDTMKIDEKDLLQGSHVDRVSSVEFLFFATGITSMSQVIRSLDEMRHLTKRLCGEIPFAGFDEWKRGYKRNYRRTSRNNFS